MIHQYKQNGYNIVIDVYTGSIHVVDDIAYDMISLMDLKIIENTNNNSNINSTNGKNSIISDNSISINENIIILNKFKEEIISNLHNKYKIDPEGSLLKLGECFEQIIDLIKDEKLFTNDTFINLAKDTLNNKKPVLKALCLHIAHSCNLNCSYCFASQGHYKGEEALMSFETGKKALNYLIEHSENRKNLEVDFFGGEPLLNFKVVKELVEYGRSIEKKYNKNFRFTLTTNGVLLDDEVIEFANREMHNVVLSLDGRKETHDRFRVDYNGVGSFDKIVPKFQKLVEGRGDKSYYMRGTFTHYNPDFLEDIKEMLSLGFSELSMEPVVTDKNSPSYLTDVDREIVKKQYEDLLNLMIEKKKEGKPFTFYHYMMDLLNGPCIQKRISGCGSGSEYLAVTPSGDLYPCHQFVGDEKYLLGNLEEGIIEKDIQKEFLNCNIYAHKECNDCWAKLYCAGGCSANAYHGSGSINGVYKEGCELFKKRVECALILAIHSEIGES